MPVGEDEQFLALWRRVNGYGQGKDGYLGHALHRSLATSTHNRYVNVALWASREHFEAATDDVFRALVAEPGWARFPAAPGLYEVVDRAAASGSDGGCGTDQRPRRVTTGLAGLAAVPLSRPRGPASRPSGRTCSACASCRRTTKR